MCLSKQILSLETIFGMPSGGCVQVCQLFADFRVADPSVSNTRKRADTLVTILETQAAFDLQLKAFDKNVQQTRDCIQTLFENIKADLDAAEQRVMVAFDCDIRNMSKVVQARKDALDVWCQQLAGTMSLDLDLNLDSCVSTPICNADSMIAGLKDTCCLVSKTLAVFGNITKDAEYLDALATSFQDCAANLIQKSTEVKAKAAFSITKVPRKHYEGSCIFSASIDVGKNDGVSSSLTRVAVSPDGSMLAVAGSRFIALVSLESVRVTKYVDQGYMQHRMACIQSMCFSSRGDSLFINDDVGNVCMYEITLSGNVVKQMYGSPFAEVGYPFANVLTFDISCSADVVVARVYKTLGNVDGIICVYDAQTANLLRSFDRINRDCRLALSSDGQKVVVVYSAFVVVFNLMGEVCGMYQHGCQAWLCHVFVPRSGDMVARYQADGWLHTISTDGSSPRKIYVKQLHKAHLSNLIAVNNGFGVVTLSTRTNTVAIDIVI